MRHIKSFYCCDVGFGAICGDLYEIRLQFLLYDARWVGGGIYGTQRLNDVPSTKLKNYYNCRFVCLPGHSLTAAQLNGCQRRAKTRNPIENVLHHIKHVFYKCIYNYSFIHVVNTDHNCSID